MSKESLRECPFCGNEKLRLIDQTVQCVHCGAMGPHDTGEEHWNRRVPSERERLLEKVVEAAKIAVLPYEHPDHDQDAIVHLSIALEAFQIHDDARGEEKI